MRKILTLVIITGSLSSCMLTASTPSGIKEFYRGQTGLVVTGKAKPNTDDSYHQTQRATDYNSLQALQTKLEGMNNE